MSSFRPARYLQESTFFGGYHQMSLGYGNAYFFSVYTGNVDAYVKQQLQVWGNGTLIYDSGLTNSGSPANFLLFSFNPRIYTTVRLRGYTEGWDRFGLAVTSTLDITVDIQSTVPSFGSIVTLNPSGANANTAYFFDAPSLNTFYYIKNLSSSKGAYIIPNAPIDNDQIEIRIPPKGGIVLGGIGSNWYIVSYYNGQLTAASGFSDYVITETASIVSVDLTNGGKNVLLPSASPSRMLVISGFTTGTGTSNLLQVKGSMSEESGVAIRPNGNPACGLLFVSNGSIWCVVGAFAGTNTTFDAGQMNADVTGTLVVSSTTNRDSITVLPVDTNENGRLQFFKTLNNVSYGNGAVVGSKDGNFTVNTNYKRFYRNSNTPFSAYAFVSIRRSAWGHTRLFPIAMYPSEY